MIKPPVGSADCAWLALRLALWPEVSQAGHLSGMADAVARGHYVRLALAGDGAALGFVEASKRVDYVNGTSSSPVAFLEGLYVVSTVRRQGVARTLVESVVKWALQEGCTELASDALSTRRWPGAAGRLLHFAVRRQHGSPHRHHIRQSRPAKRCRELAYRAWGVWCSPREP